MSEASRRGLPSLRVAGAAAVLAALWVEMLTGGTGWADQMTLQAIYAGGHPLLVGIAKGFTFVGSSWVGIAVSIGGVALLAWIGRRRDATVAVLVIAVGRILVEVQKYALGRARPDIVLHLVLVHTPSFPSGHAANSMIVCLTYAIIFFGHSRRRGLAVMVALLLSLCIGLSRLMLGVHWPSDVVGGWAFGLLWVVLALPLAERLAGE